MKDTRYCYGASCTWHGPISEVSNTGNHPRWKAANIPKDIRKHSMPCCPICGGMLMEFNEPSRWWSQVDEFERKGHPNYRAMLVWQREQKICFREMSQLVRAYKEIMGVEVAL